MVLENLEKQMKEDADEPVDSVENLVKKHISEQAADL